MTNSTNQQAHQPAAMRQTLIEDIDACLTDGMPVFDKYGEQVGHVKMYHTAAGYLQVGTGVFERTDLYLPFRLIRSIDPHDIFLTETKDALESTYTEPPTISTVVEHRLVLGPHGAMTPQTYEVQVVSSGYDDQPAAFNRVDLSSVAERLAVGMVVYDTRGERLGDLTEYDTSRGLLLVEKGIFKPQALLVPFSAIQEIQPRMYTVYLSLPREVLLHEQATLPTDARSPADARPPADAQE